MATNQYDKIAANYSAVADDLPCSILERTNLQIAAEPYVQGAKVLDLACGAGLYSRRLLEWGAESVVGVDLSEGMVQIALAESGRLGIPQDKLRFEVGDATSELKVGDGRPFDLVIAAWLLNYSASRDMLERMFSTVLANLATGGKFISLSIPPPESEAELRTLLSDVWPEQGLGGHITKVLEDGFAVHNVLQLPGGGHQTASFDNFYLRKEVIENAAFASGFKRADWRDEIVVPHYVLQEQTYGLTAESWERAAKSPEFKICVFSR